MNDPRPRITVGEPDRLRAAVAQVEGPAWAEWEALAALDPHGVDRVVEDWRPGLCGVIHGVRGLHRYEVRPEGEVVFSEPHGTAAVARARAAGFRTTGDPPLTRGSWVVVRGRGWTHEAVVEAPYGRATPFARTRDRSPGVWLYCYHTGHGYKLVKVANVADHDP